MEKSNFTIETSSFELKKFLESLLNGNLEELPIKDPNYMIKELELENSSSRDRGWSGSLCNKTIVKVKNAPLSSFLIIYNKKDLLNTMIASGYPLKSIKGEFVESFNYRDGKDSHSINRYTYSDFYTAHLYSEYEPYLSEEDQKNELIVKAHKSILDLIASEKANKCGYYEVQYKSPIYCSNNRFDMYEDGYVGKISNCDIQEMKTLTAKIFSSYDNLDRKSKKI